MSVVSSDQLKGSMVGLVLSMNGLFAVVPGWLWWSRFGGSVDICVSSGGVGGGGRCPSGLALARPGFSELSGAGQQEDANDEENGHQFLVVHGCFSRSFESLESTRNAC